MLHLHSLAVPATTIPEASGRTSVARALQSKIVQIHPAKTQPYFVSSFITDNKTPFFLTSKTTFAFGRKEMCELYLVDITA